MENLNPRAGVELVDRPHQPRVSLLDQVEEADAAVAIPLGDGDDEPEVSLGELLPVGVVDLLEGGDAGQAAVKRPPRLVGGLHQAPQFPAESGLPLRVLWCGLWCSRPDCTRRRDACTTNAAPQVGQLAPYGVHSPGNVLEPLQDQVEILPADRRLLDQADRLRPANKEPPTGFPPVAGRSTAGTRQP